MGEEIMKGRIKSLNISEKRGIKKCPVESAVFKTESGIEGDAHAATGTRQVSLLAWEGISGQSGNLRPGDFAENITTEGIELEKITPGTIIRIGKVRLRISKIGKRCVARCEIFKLLGNCIMPSQGVFAEVLEGGTVRVGDEISCKP